MTRLVVHCSDSPNDRDVTAEDIHWWHKEKGWSGIGYNAVIRRSGEVERGRPHYWKGAHVGIYNKGSLGVCLIGRDQFTDEQLAALRELLTEWKHKYPDAEVMGHYELDPNKPCPNFDVKAWWNKEVIV
ncbi:MAG: N-acetylmuramoyl-L-alanine amidase [gamma proteobacterium symbiont of Ctena orbiculata]|nr:MAG: N-acetylmuramoyl-L-alanine amidase [gamma proteobacterium symbiont of Ctena orbiculata]